MHQHFHKGKRLLLIKKSGKQIVAKYIKTEGKLIYLEDMEPIRLDTLRAITYYKKGLAHDV
jgi:hypothetical protein